MLSKCVCKLTPRKSQREVLELVFERKADERKLYVVSPPGSGKTITGLMIAVRMNVPTLVLAPNTAIQAQWIDKTRYFLPEGHAAVASADPDDEAPIKVLTYQALAQTGEVSQADREEILDAWRTELIEQDGYDPDEASAWLAELSERNPDRFETSLLNRWKRLRLGTDELDAAKLVSAGSVELIDKLRRVGIGLVIFDECHHLTGYWAQVAELMLEVVKPDRILGLTATPPAQADMTPREAELHRRLLDEIDYHIVTPAVVRDGHLAPYQDLAWFTRPRAEELEFVRRCSTTFRQVFAMTERHEGTRLSDWLIAQIEEVPKKNLNSTLRRRQAFFSAAIRYLKEVGREVPRGLAAFAEGPTSLSDRADLVGRYGARCLLVGEKEIDRKLFGALSVAFRPLGYQMTEKGLRMCQSTVGRVLALSRAKMDAMVEVLSHEVNTGHDVRAIVVTDFEKSSATIAKDISDLLTEESGGAIAAMRALTSHETTDRLDPILVTGQSVIVDDDLLERFMEEAGKWIEQHALKAALSARLDGGFYHIDGAGRDWTTRNYIVMITEFFERGITRCLVGTRGLLGEGWDSLCANTLVDLTTAATEMTVNQLRGRAIRLDPSQPEKVANIWDVVCMAPEFEHGLSDYLRFARKHKSYFGLCDDGAIEYGLGHIHPALTDAGPEDVALNAHVFNAEMTQRLAGRGAIYRQWKVGTPYHDTRKQTVETRVDEAFDQMPVRRAGRWMEGYEISRDERMRMMCLAVAEGLAQLGLLEDTGAHVKVSSRSERYFRVFLESARQRDIALFTDCVRELFGPLDQARYIIPRYQQVWHDTWLSKLMPTVLRKYFVKKENRIAVYHAVPGPFGKSKDNAEVFADLWNRYVSPGRPTYVRQGKGQNLLLNVLRKKMALAGTKVTTKTVWE